MYLVDGEELFLEQLNADEAAVVLAGLTAESARTTDAAAKAAVAQRIREVSDWLDDLADDAVAAVARDDAAEHAEALFADALAGI